jgi:hypothetical protein
MMEVFLDPLAASDWNMYRTTRIILNLSWFHSLHKLPQSTDALNRTHLKFQILDNIYTLSGQIASSVPYLLLVNPESTSLYPLSTEMIRGIWGYMITWPVSIAFSCYKSGQITDIGSQKQWFSTVLRFLRDNLGLAKAEAFHDTYE